MIRTHSYTPTACDTCVDTQVQKTGRLTLPATWLPIMPTPPTCRLGANMAPISSQDRPTLPSSVNTWDGLLLPTQPWGSCWCAYCCQLMCHWNEVLLFHWETNCIGRRVKAEVTSLCACRRGGPYLQLRDGNNAILMKVMAQWHGASSTTVKTALQQEQRYQPNDATATSQISMCSNTFFVYVLYG